LGNRLPSSERRFSMIGFHQQLFSVGRDPSIAFAPSENPASM